MESISYKTCMQKLGVCLLILLGIIGFLSFKLIKYGYSLEYLILLAGSILGLIAVSRLGIISKLALSEPDFKLKNYDHFFTGEVLIISLGIMSIYLFFVKGLYGLYELIHSFSWFLLFFRIMIIVLTFKLVSAVSVLQTVYKSIERKTYTNH